MTHTLTPAERSAISVALRMLCAHQPTTLHASVARDLLAAEFGDAADGGKLGGLAAQPASHAEPDEAEISSRGAGLQSQPVAAQGWRPIETAPSIEDAERMGQQGAKALGVPHSEAERRAFEAWMHGHCWALCATWRGTEYRSDAEVGGCVDPRAIRTRQLWAAWRDRAALIPAAPGAAPAEPPADPMDWPLPCDVTVGHGTMRKGVSLRTLVTRMKVLYEMATGHNADKTAARTDDEKAAAFADFCAQLQGAAPTQSKPLDDPRLQDLFWSAISGAIAFGAQGANRPPAGHWLTPAWEMGHATAAEHAAELVALRAAPADAGQQALTASPNARTVAGHIEQRLLTWRQQRTNRSGDRLALDDFMDGSSIADLVDFVCDEYALDAALRAHGITAQPGVGDVV